MAYTTINKSSDYFNTKLWTGTGAENAITGVGFQPDWVWIKNRDAVEHNKLYDAVRGANKVIYSNLTNAEATVTQDVKSFDSDGFTLGTESAVNASGQNIVGWNWKANGAGSSNTDGDVTSTVSANQTSGFSIVTVSNLNSNSFGHGLGAEPHLIISKRTDDVASWRVYYKGIASGKSLFLNTDAAETTETSAIASANSSTVTVTGSGNGGTAGTGDTVYYCFAPVKGFSKIGSYEGNGNADGSFIYTGFKPAFIMIKSYNTAARNWTIQDNKRSSSGGPNPNDKWLYANSNEAEANQAGNPMDFLSNGFKLRNTGSYQNQNAYIYMAFAEAPLVGSNNVPATAR